MTIEIKEIRVKWQNSRQALLRADYNHADEELARVIYFADHNPIISNILNKLRLNPAYQSLDSMDWIKRRNWAGTVGSGRTNLNFSLDEKDRCAQCLKILELAVSQFNNGADGLVSIGLTTYGGPSTKFNDYIHSAIENLFDPLYYYVDSELRSLETLISPVDILDEIIPIVDNKAGLHYPETYRLLKESYKQLFSLTAGGSEVSWYQIGYICRAVLTEFANEIFDPSYLPKDQDQPKNDDASNKLKLTARYFLRSSGVGDRYRESIEKIIQANWDFVSNMGHRRESATEKDARLAVIYTYLTIYLLDSLKNN